MMIIRPIAMSDLDDLYRMAQSSGVGVTTLPANRDLLAMRIQLSERSFTRQVPAQQANYLFALEDTEQPCVVGVSAIEASVGLSDVWYNYRVCESVHASRELGVHTSNKTLYLTNDLTGCSEVCTLFLDEKYRHSANGRFLSKCRFLFMREYSSLFDTRVIAEMRGYSDAQGHSPFWESLGRVFFQTEFSRADYMVGTGNKSFIAELMPKYPIYVSFLSPDAQQVIGQVHDNTRPALSMLEQEGFSFSGLVDIFDAGPIVEAMVANVRAVRESSTRQVLVEQEPARASDKTQEDRHFFLVSNRAFEDFRTVLLPARQVRQDTISIPESVSLHLQVNTGDTVRVLPLRYQEDV